jgi:hypothetical protein
MITVSFSKDEIQMLSVAVDVKIFKECEAAIALGLRDPLPVKRLEALRFRLKQHQAEMVNCPNCKAENHSCNSFCGTCGFSMQTRNK